MKQLLIRLLPFSLLIGASFATHAITKVEAAQADVASQAVTVRTTTVKPVIMGALVFVPGENRTLTSVSSETSTESGMAGMMSQDVLTSEISHKLPANPTPVQQRRFHHIHIFTYDGNTFYKKTSTITTHKFIPMSFSAFKLLERKNNKLTDQHWNAAESLSYRKHGGSVSVTTSTIVTIIPQPQGSSEQVSAINDLLKSHRDTIKTPKKLQALAARTNSYRVHLKGMLISSATEIQVHQTNGTINISKQKDINNSKRIEPYNPDQKIAHIDIPSQTLLSPK